MENVSNVMARAETWSRFKEIIFTVHMVDFDSFTVPIKFKCPLVFSESHNLEEIV